MATLYDLISELRREHPTPSASRTLDLVVSELGLTRDNLRSALARLDDREVPAGGRAVLDELASRAATEGVDDNEAPPSRDEVRAATEPVDASQVGIAVVMAVSALVVLGLTVLAVVAGLNAILHFV